MRRPHRFLTKPNYLRITIFTHLPASLIWWKAVWCVILPTHPLSLTPDMEPTNTPPATPPYGGPGYTPPGMGGPGFGGPGYGGPGYGGMNPGGPPPKNWLVESILVTIFCCLPFGIVGIINAASVNTKYAAGDYAGAQEASAAAGKWTKIGLFASLAGWVLYILFVVVLGVGGGLLQGMQGR